MQKAKRITILIFLLILLIYFSGIAFNFVLSFYPIKEEVTYYTYNAGFIIELIFIFSTPIFVLLSIVFNLKLLISISKKTIEDSSVILKVKINKFLFYIYFIFSIVLILHSLLKLYDVYGLYEFRNEIGDLIYYLKIQVIVLLVLIFFGIIFFIDILKLRKKHIKS